MKTTLSKINSVIAEMPELEKSKKGYGYSYTPLDDIMKELNPLLIKNKLGLIHIIDEDEKKNLILKTIVSDLENKDAKDIVLTKTINKIGLKGMNEYQVEGAAMTYYRRYHISAIFRLTSVEDIDAKGKQVKQKDKQQKHINTPSIIDMFNKLLSKPNMTKEKIKALYLNSLKDMDDELKEKLKNLINSKFENLI